MATRKILGKVIAEARASHTGRDGDLFFDDSSNQFFISDGTTAGGAPLVLNTLRNVAAFTASTNLTVAQSGSVITGNAAAGMTVTLPAAAAGLQYSIHVGTTITSNAFTISGATSADTMQGQLISNDFTDLGSITLLNESVATVGFDQPEAADHQIVMNGTTTGGKLGSYVNCTAISASKWMVDGLLSSDGSLATCFT
jgi:hypothetical protein